jgi:hypothetical protein
LPTATVITVVATVIASQLAKVVMYIATGEVQRAT